MNQEGQEKFIWIYIYSRLRAPNGDYNYERDRRQTKTKSF
jgi:hypothetical protein